MKRCLQCNADYADETLNYCLDDGSLLVGANGDEPVTAVLGAFVAPSGGVSDNDQTRVLRPDPSTGNYRSSIAVLPFVNMSADADNEYFCDGLAEELLNALAKIDDLKVAA